MDNLDQCAERVEKIVQQLWEGGDRLEFDRSLLKLDIAKHMAIAQTLFPTAGAFSVNYVERLQNRMDKLTEALVFYANIETYRGHGMQDALIRHDGGQIARDALNFRG